MKGKKFLSIAIAMLVVAGMALGLTRNAFADHALDLLELDRNALDPGGAPAPDDWATLYSGGGFAESFTGILPDIGADGGTQFQGGGSKDNNNIDQWLWKVDEPLDKDDVTNAYAAGYIYQGSEVCPPGVPPGGQLCTEPGDLIIYFGLDRYANNGSAQVGFWFFQNPVGLADIPSGGGFQFSGTHSLGDLLIQSNFSQGGVISNISVFEWVGSGGSNGALNLVFSADDCLAGASEGDPACATVNQSDTASPWPYTPKAGSPGTFPQGSFFEGGVNVSALVPDAGCFSGFMAETRTSTPFDSRLKDFALGSLSLCHIEGTKYLDVNGNGTRDQGEPPLANWQIQLSGAASMTAYTDANGHYSFDDLGNGSYTVTEVCPAASPAWVQTEPGASLVDSCGAETYSFNISLNNTVGIGDFGNGAPAVAVTKTCTAVVEVGKPISYGFDVTNTGNVNLANVDVKDPTVGFDNSPNLSLSPAGTHHYSAQVTGPLSAQIIINTVSASGDFGTSPVYATVTDSASCTTQVVDARISISPDATNEVGDSHTFTVLAEKNEGQGAGWVAANDGTIVAVTLTDFNGASSSVTTDTCATGTVNGLCSVTFSSESTGITTGHASATILSGGLSLARETDDLAGNSADASKVWVDARISISPDATNEVGDSHTFSVVAEKNEGQGAGWVAADDGTIVAVTLTDSNGASSSVATDTCATGTVNGLCSVTFSSDVAGTTTGHASATILSGGLSLARETDGLAGNSADATKVWVDAHISISPDATNEVGDSHTFSVVAEKNEGQGAGWEPADDGTLVAVTLTDSNGASSSVSTDTCATGTINGLCSVTFSSGSAGTTTGHASATILSGGLSLARETDGLAGNSADATKVWVDARISISPDGTNGIGEDHTFDVLVEKNEGQGGGWVPADDGTLVAVTLTDSNGASSNVSSESCSTGTVSGICSVTFSSDVAGTSTGHASATIISGGLSLARETDSLAGNSGDATKIWVAGSLSWLKQDDLGNSLGGATFEVCRTFDRFGNDIPDECVTVLDNNAPDADPDSGEFLLVDLFLGTYTIEETFPPVGYSGDSFVDTVVLTLADPNGAAIHTWVNAPVNLGCTPGFWQGGAGAQLWDGVDDSEWVPYTHDILFNDFFSLHTDPRLDGYTMYELVSMGGGSDPAIKAARDMVAAYLNESAFPDDFPATSLADLETMWYNAVLGGDSALSAFHVLVSSWNDPAAPGYCPLP